MPSRHTAIVPAPPPARPCVFVPLLGIGRELPEPTDAAAVAAGLLAAGTGQPVSAADVEVVAVAPATLLLPSVPRPVEVRHPEGGRWCRGVRTGWVRGASGSWRPLVSYELGGVRWERVVRAGAWRPADLAPREPGAAGLPAAGPLHESVALQRRARRLLRELADVEDAVAATLERMADRVLARGRLADAELLADRARQARARACRARGLTSATAAPAGAAVAAGTGAGDR